MSLACIPEEDEPTGMLSHASSTSTVIHMPDAEKRILWPSENELSDYVIGRLSFCVFNFSRPSRRWWKMLELPHIQPLFLCALDYYTTRKREYRYIYENVLLSKQPTEVEYTTWIKRMCRYVVKELREQHALMLNANRSSCEPR